MFFLLLQIVAHFFALFFLSSGSHLHHHYCCVVYCFVLRRLSSSPSHVQRCASFFTVFVNARCILSLHFQYKRGFVWWLSCSLFPLRLHDRYSPIFHLNSAVIWIFDAGLSSLCFVVLCYYCTIRLRLGIILFVTVVLITLQHLLCCSYFWTFILFLNTNYLAIRILYVIVNIVLPAWNLSCSSMVWSSIVIVSQLTT